MGARLGCTAVGAPRRPGAGPLGADGGVPEGRGRAVVALGMVRTPTGVPTGARTRPGRAGTLPIGERTDGPEPGAPEGVCRVTAGTWAGRLTPCGVAPAGRIWAGAKCVAGRGGVAVGDDRSGAFEWTWDPA